MNFEANSYFKIKKKL